ncbi:hypothetical protein JCM9279_005214 [Rhodotorula babjevae]
MADAPSRSPSPRPAANPSSSRDHALADHDDQGHPRREVVVLSPRESPTPPLGHEPAAAPTAPTLRVLAASPPPPPPHDPLAIGDQPRSLLRQLASAGTATAGPSPLPVEPADPSHLAPDLYYDAAGRLRTTTSNSRVRRAALSPPAPDARPTGDEGAAAAGEEDAEQALLVSSLRAGDASRTRRRFYRGRSMFAAAAAATAARDGGDEVVGDTGWVQLAPGTAAYPEVSPEELRAAREAWIDAGAGAGGPSFFFSSPSSAMATGTGGAAVEEEGRTGSMRRSPTELAIEALHAEREAAQRQLEASERNFAAATAQLAAHRTLGDRMDSAFGSSLWRNEPQSIPRSGALPRGGRLVRPLPTTYSPANPPVRRLPFDPSDSDSSASSADEYATWLESVGARAPVSADAGDGEPRRQRRGGPQRTFIVDSSDEDSDQDDGDREWQQLEAEAMAASRAADRRDAAARRDGDDAPALFGRRRPVVRPPPSSSPPPEGVAPQGPSAALRESPRRRTREETNAMMGAALRSKKPVALLYCGGAGAEGLPAGFSWADDATAPTSASTSASASSSASASTSSGAAGKGKGRARAEGCGALVCARALVDGVPGKVFEDQGREEPAASSDLPPCADKVADFGGDEGELGGERIGKRGWRGCKGCLTRDVGCKRCGNHLGYRLLRPCVTCSISRPTYTSYASAVTSAYPPQPLVLSAGGVTGGGVVDGLLFHYRLDSITSLARLVGRTPADELDVEERSRSRSGEGGESDGEGEGGSRDRAPDEASGDGGGWAAGRPDGPVPRRLRERPPRTGERMRWKAIPSAQRDFQDGLVGEPSDWIDPEGETWWLDNAIAKHARKRTASGAWGEGGNAGVLNTDRLSTASTTVNNAATGAVASPSASASGSTLSRSHAIRTRIPLSRAINPHAPSFGTSARDSSTSSGLYDRYRSDAATYSRRVRRRLADPSAAGGAVVGSLERAGYGSGFELEADEERTREQDRAEREREPRGERARAAARRKEVVGR